MPVNPSIGYGAELVRHGLRKTAMREQVLAIFHRHKMALAQSDLEKALGTADRITLYRTIRAFEDAGLIHRAFDGGPTPRWALCHGHCTDHGHNDSHAHFHCARCQRTLCLENVAVPPIKVPSGFVVNDAQVVLSGLCEACV